jgi:hypothetical protein
MSRWLKRVVLGLVGLAVLAAGALAILATIPEHNQKQRAAVVQR